MHDTPSLSCLCADTQVKSDIQAEVRHATEQAVSTKGQSGASACSLLHTAISKLVQQGIPYASILALTAAALPTPPLQHVALQPCGYTADVSAPALLASQIDTTVDECLGRFKQGPAHSSGVSSSPGPAEQLQMVLQCLSDGEEAPEPHVSEARDSVRHSVVRRVTTCVEGLDTAQYSQPQVAELLRVHASLMSGEVRGLRGAHPRVRCIACPVYWFAHARSCMCKQLAWLDCMHVPASVVIAMLCGHISTTYTSALCCCVPLFVFAGVARVSV